MLFSHPLAYLPPARRRSRGHQLSLARLHFYGGGPEAQIGHVSHVDNHRREQRRRQLQRLPEPGVDAVQVRGRLADQAGAQHKRRVDGDELKGRLVRRGPVQRGLVGDNLGGHVHGAVFALAAGKDLVEVDFVSLAGVGCVAVSDS